MLRGMRKILSKGKVKIICEVQPEQLLSLGYSTKEIEELLRQYNYNIYLISEEEREQKLILIDEILKDTRGHYLFTKEAWRL